MYRRGWLTLMLIGCLWTFPAEASDKSWQSPAYILDAFYRIAMKSEYIEGERGIRKWQAPIRYHITHPISSSELHDNLVAYHLSHLQSITGVAFTPTDRPERANLSIVFTNHARFLDDARKQFATDDVSPLENATCAANIKVDRHGVIQYAAVVIPVDLARSKGKLVACVVEELTQVMGLPNDDNRVYPSIFNDQSSLQLLTGLDSLLLQLLYLNVVKPGQNWETTQAIIRPVIMKWAQDGTINNAHRAVKTGKLYPLLGW